MMNKTVTINNGLDLLNFLKEVPEDILKRTLWLGCDTGEGYIPATTVSIEYPILQQIDGDESEGLDDKLHIFIGDSNFNPYKSFPWSVTYEDGSLVPFSDEAMIELGINQDDFYDSCANVRVSVKSILELCNNPISNQIPANVIATLKPNENSGEWSIRKFDNLPNLLNEKSLAIEMKKINELQSFEGIADFDAKITVNKK